MPLEVARIEAIQETLPDPVVLAFVYATDLGDPLFVILVVSATYLFVDHHRGGFLVGATAAGYGLTVALKELLAVPRPPPEVQLVEATGFGIPSGHALGTVVVFGVLAEDLDVGTRTQRYAVAATLVSVVSVSRVVTGVHYPVDVVAGVVLGVAVLGFVYRFDLKRPLPLFAVGVVGSLAAIVLSGLTYATAFVVFGLALGGLLTWFAVAPLPDPGRRITVATGAVALPVAVFVIPIGPSPPVTALTVVPTSVIGMAMVLTVPSVAARLERAIAVTGRVD